MPDQASVATDSLRDAIRAGRESTMHKQAKDFPIPGYGGRLWGTFKALDDYRDARRIVKQNEAADEATSEMQIAAATLAASCTGVFAVVDGGKHPLEMGLSPALVKYLLDETVENSTQAVFMLFPDTLSVVTFYGEIETWFRSTGAVVDKELEGNSEAAS